MHTVEMTFGSLDVSQNVQCFVDVEGQLNGTYRV